LENYWVFSKKINKKNLFVDLKSYEWTLGDSECDLFDTTSCETRTRDSSINHKYKNIFNYSGEFHEVVLGVVVLN
jgi:hypothetical protein